MGAVSLTTVVSFESVGAILIVAFLIVPPATAYLITHKLKKMLLLSSFFGVLSAVGGYFLAVLIDGSIAGAMASIAGLLFLFVWSYTLFLKKKLTSNLDIV